MGCFFWGEITFKKLLCLEDKKCFKDILGIYPNPQQLTLMPIEWCDMFMNPIMIRMLWSKIRMYWLIVYAGALMARCSVSLEIW